MKTAIAWAAAISVGLAALLAPALWNGFALVFFDTGGYIVRAMDLSLAPGRSLFYGLFLWAFSGGWQWFWGPVLAQALLTLWAVRLLLRCHGLPAGPAATALAGLGLSLFTGISWYASQLMPDGLAALLVLALWLLGFRWQALSWGECAGLGFVALLGLLSHMSCMALALGLLAVTALARWRTPAVRPEPVEGLAQRGGRLSATLAPPALVVAASLLLMPLLHLALVGKAGYTPGGPAFVFGRLVQDGIAQRWLAEHCPAPGIQLCDLQDRLPHSADDFLWGNASPFHALGGWGRADAELGYLNKACLQAYPAELAWTALRAAAQQLAKVATGDGLDEYQPDAERVFTQLLPQAAENYRAARQQHQQIAQPLFDALNSAHVPVAYLSMLGLPLVVAWGWRNGRHDLAGLALFVALALLGNAFICGALSNPHDRYQSRLVWIATLVVGMAAASRRQT
ncbi:MAG: hypothetical protein ACKN9T_18545 [Candidatus Methylumidiphilus sp.]